jgi:hypothetical protein
VIPPIYAKQQFIRSFMAPVWRDARQAIIAADHVVFFGYSMPLLDVEAEKEFQRAITRNSKLSHVSLVNPAAVSASRYAEAFPRQPVHWHSDLGRFLKAHPFA